MNNKRVIFYFISLLILILPIVNAQQTPSNDPGVTPDSFLWGLDKALEQLNLLLTFDEGKEAKKGLEIARERLLEIKIMAEENNFEAVEKAREEHRETLVKVKNDINEIEGNNNDIDDLEEIIEIEKELEEHDDEIEETFGELKVKIKVKGEITKEQKDLIDSILNSLKGQTGEVEIEIKNKKDETKIKIKQESGKSEGEIEIEIENIEKEKGIKKEEKALEAINDAKEELSEFLEESREDNLVVSQDLLNQFNSLLELAENQLEQGIFLEARKLAKQAEELLEAAEEEVQKEEEREIEVEIEESIAKVEINLGEEKLEFELETTDLDSIINEIVTRTGLSKEEINKIIKVENEEIEDKEEDNDKDNEDDNNERDQNSDDQNSKSSSSGNFGSGNGDSGKSEEDD